MKIGFDAKRAFHNSTGLGNYSRTLIESLSEYFPENEYFLFNPKASKKYFFKTPHTHEIRPHTFLSKKISSLWRSSWVKKDLQKLRIDLYHGLSHEIPFGIQHTKTKSVVTMHDLIIERYPGQFRKTDLKIYRKKYINACRHADRIIAISYQTKKDIVDFYKIDEKKIDVCYQSCDKNFLKKNNAEDLARIREKYRLPPQYFLSVGSVIERKNLLNVCKALLLLKEEVNIPLVVIGKGKNAYRKKLDDFIERNQLQQNIIFLSEKFDSFNVWNDLPAIYQMSSAMVYVSVFEGFGIPILEALNCGVPVITSNLSCMPEVGGNAAFYVNPYDAEDIAHAMKKVYSDESLRCGMIAGGYLQAQNFSAETCAAGVMNVYKKILENA